MSSIWSRRIALGSVIVSTLVVLAIVSEVAHAAVVVSRAEVNSGRLRIEGSSTPSRTIPVDGVAMGSSDGSGAFRIERSGYTPPADCTVDVNDGSATPTTARLWDAQLPPLRPHPCPRRRRH